MHLGIITPPVPGHIHPFGALGRELVERGHRVTVLHMEEVRCRAEAEGLDFVAIGQLDHPQGSLAVSLVRLGALSGLAALRFTIGAIRQTTEMFCRDAPGAIRAAGIEALLVDQTEPAGGSIAEFLGIPFITICNALNLNEEPGIPPPFTAWKWSDSRFARIRNGMGYRASGLFMRPVHKVVQAYRREWGLARQYSLQESFSPLAQISQLTASFDYPRERLPSHFSYTGPLRKAATGRIPFPWERLDGRPLIYASLGTLQNGREEVFRTFSEACSMLNAQLVIAGMEPEGDRRFPGEPVVVGYAPQLELLQRAALTLTHCGLNTVLDSLACGVPLVGVPINYEQPAIAERVRWAGAAEIVDFRKLSAGAIRTAIQKVWGNSSYQRRAGEIARCIHREGGVRRAANLIEAAL